MQIETTELLSELRAKAAELVEARETNSVTADLDEAEFDELDLDKYSLEEIQEFMESEDYDNLDELSKNTLASYVNKADRDIDYRTNLAAKAHKAAQTVKFKSRADKAAMIDRAEGYAAKADKRNSGIKRAIEKQHESEELDFTELFAGEELSEEFKLKATAMFEAAVAERVEREVQERIEFLGEAYSEYTEEISQSALNEQTELTEGLVERVDGYLDYMVEQWIANNELALERGIKSELFESFMVGMKGLFEEHMITVPEGQLDVLDELNTVNDELKSKADALLAENVELKQSLKQIGRKTQIMEAASGLSDLEMDRFVTLAEGLSYVDADNFGKKLSVIRESFFDKEVASKQLIESVVTKDSYLIEETEPVQPRMDPAIAAYVSALSRTAV